MSESVTTKGESFFDEEEIENGVYKIKFHMPHGIKPDQITIKTKNNGFFIEYRDEVGKEQDGWTYHNANKGYFARNFPFGVTEPKARLENDSVIFTFKKGESIKNGRIELDMDKESINP